MSRAFRRWIALSAGGLVLGLAPDGPPRAQDSGAAREGFSAVQALQIVDCLLPGQVRGLGRRSYLTPRRPARTTAADCAARGGEYLVYDRADYRSALTVWLPAAQEGDLEAQTIVGEIYERGFGGTPDHEAAAQWYRRAAEQGFARAAFNLGALYEQGLGVGQDGLEALNWYRRASGLAADSVIFRSAAAAEQAAARSRLLEQIERRDRQIEDLSREIESLNERLESRSLGSEDVQAELDAVRARLELLESDRRADERALDALPAAAEPRRATASALGGSFEQREQLRYRQRDFGRFYALIIGVQDYELLDDLVSPANDALRVAQILEQRYGFSVVTLTNPDQLSVMRAINELNDLLDEDDNLLIYFSGHGNRLRSGVTEPGYWLPSNAEPAPDDTLWVPNDFVTRHLGRIRAKRALVVADSCYAGLLGDEPGYVMIGDRQYTDEYIEWKMPKRARLVLSSGGDSPVVESPEQQHSVFARALLGALEANDQVLTAPELFLRVRERMGRSNAGIGSAREPELKALRDAGHEVGDFFFVPTRG